MFSLIRAGQGGEVWRIACRRVYSESRFMVLACDLGNRPPPPTSERAMTVRPLKSADLAELLDLDVPGITAGEVADKIHQWRLLQAGLDTCYVALSDDKKPIFMSWLVRDCDNDRLRYYFGDSVSPLRHGEMLIEGVFTLKPYRRRGVMQAACAMLADIAVEMGAGRLLAYVNERNGASLAAFARLGYIPDRVRTERWRFGRRTVSFSPMVG